MAVYICRTCPKGTPGVTRQPYKDSSTKYWTCMKCAPRRPNGREFFVEEITTVPKEVISTKRAKIKLF